MKRVITNLFVVFLFSVLQRAFGQGFDNLDFEQASVYPASPSHVPWDASSAISADFAFPYWTVMEDGTICDSVSRPPYALDETYVGLVAPGYSPIEGSYSVQLSAYADAPSGYFRSSSISQTGAIPFGTHSIQFLIARQAGLVQSGLLVIVNESPISLIELSQSGGVSAMAGDISAFAGTTATVSFVCEAETGGDFPANEKIYNLDSIQFSPESVPEPTTVGLLGVGVVIFGWYFAKRRNISSKSVTSGAGHSPS
jgi:hypothetical protein